MKKSNKKKKDLFFSLGDSSREHEDLNLTFSYYNSSKTNNLHLTQASKDYNFLHYYLTNADMAIWVVNLSHKIPKPRKGKGFFHSLPSYSYILGHYFNLTTIKSL